MRSSFLHRVIVMSCLVAACSGREEDRGDRDAGTADAGPDPDAGDVLDAGAPDVPTPIDGGPLVETVIYAHSRDTLYTVAPETLTVTPVAPFTLPDGSATAPMIDLAVNEAGDVYTTTDTGLYRVDPETAVATHIGEFALGGDQLFALSFLARGEHRDDAETLVGAANSGVYYAIEPATAATTRLGQYPDGWLSSGDIVSVTDLGTYATVRRTGSPSDVLVRIAFAADGSSTATVVGPIESASGDPYRQVFGVGYWGRDVFGFTNAGQILRIDRTSGQAEVVASMTGAAQFWGAGVTTRAYVLF